MAPHHIFQANFLSLH